MKSISILGSTGSIGTSTLDVINRHPDKYQVLGLAAGRNVELLAMQVAQFKPSIVSVADQCHAEQLRGMLGNNTPKIVYGVGGAKQVASISEVDTVVSAIVGAAGLEPTVAAIKAKKTIALANKETMVIAGHLISKLAHENQVTILPVDSEHSAIFQSMEGHDHQGIRRILLTASGGPFRSHSKDDIDSATPVQALNHPRWDMGAKITIDSASMMNKGLEVIEAKWLFNIGVANIDVVVHPQSIIHSMVEYQDSCVMAQLGEPDMRAPIAYALAYPHRIESGVPFLDLISAQTLTFESPDVNRFPCLQLAYDAIKIGQTMPAVLNAANEIAVDAFLNERICFGDIARIVEQTMQAHQPYNYSSIADVLDADVWARTSASKLINI